MKKKPAEPTHGGARIGAGKKPVPAEQKRGTRCHTFAPDILEYFKTLAGKNEDGTPKPSESLVIETLIRKSRAFRAWQRSQTKGE